MRVAAYFGERERVADRFLADAIAEAFARHGVRAGAVLRGSEGFGDKHRRTDRLLTLSEDLPMLAVAIGSDLGALAAELAGLAALAVVDADEDGGAEAKLTAFVGRGRHEAAVAALHDAGLAGATAFLGIDGVLDGERRRARFRGGNAGVPTMVVSVGDRAALERLRPTLGGAVSLDPVRVLKRDGRRLAEPGAAEWARLTVYAGEQTGVAQHLVRRLREERAAGATCLRGIWGYHGDHAPHGDRFWALRRHVPLVTTVIDTAERTARWWAIADELTAETGLVTWEPVAVVRP